MGIYKLTATELGKLLHSREVTAVEAVKNLLEYVYKVEPKIEAYITICEAEALKMAEAADVRLQKGENISPLTGVPIAIKDNICTSGILTTCASKILYNFVPPYDATVVKRLKSAGAVIIGKTNMDEFAMGSSTENSAFKITHNPWDLERVPGGSSGGSAAAIAADAATLALGSDTGGSIRQPASLCGVVGLKPTYGRVSRYGLVAYASSLDQIGPITKNVQDCALLMNFISGKDPKDSTSADVPVPDFTQYLNRDIKGIRLGVPREYFIPGMDKDVEEALRSAINKFAELGAEIIEISLPHTDYAIATYYLCATAEASSNLARYDGVHYGYRAPGTTNIIDLFAESRAKGFGAEVKRRIMLGTYALSAGYYEAYYLKALKVRTLIKQDFEQAFEKCEVIITPTSPTPAFKIGEKIEDPLQMYLSDIFTISINLAGVPAISINCGFSNEGLPIGLQLIAPIFEDARLIQLAHAFEQASPSLQRKPSIL